MVRMGEELEQSAEAEARERENSHYYQQRLADMRLEMEDLSLREQESSRRCMELVITHVRTLCILSSLLKSSLLLSMGKMQEM